MLLLHAVSNQDPQRVKDIALERESLLIGREPVAEAGAQILELPDPERVISRLHARVEYRDGAYFLIDTSTNGVYVNQATEPLGKGREIELQDGDCLAIGDYQIQVDLSQGGEDDSPTQLGALSDQQDSNSRLDFWEEVTPVRPPPEPESSPLPSFPFAEETPQQVQAETPEVPEIPEDLFAGLEQIGERPAGPAADASRTPPAEFLSGSPLEEPFIPPSTPQPEAEAEPPLQPATSPPPPTPQPPESPPRGAVPPKASPPAGADQSLEAFLRGAGLEGQIETKDLPEDVLTAVGGLTRILVRGLMDLLRSRSQIKNELRLSMTILGGVENNPLKFTATVDDALLHLMRPMPGYLGPEEAVEEAVDDLIAHQVAVISGMQAAIKTLLRRFDPGALEQRMEKLYPVAAHVPLQKQAKLWSLFEQSYEELNRELEEDFLQLFGRLFAEAYEDQVERLKRERR